jgi:uncharacterized protein YgiM (DUF1202 family)
MKKMLILILSIIMVMESNAQKLRTTQPTNYLREGPASYFQIVVAISASVDVNKMDQKGSWLKVKTEQSDIGWLSENSFANTKGNNSRDENILKGKTSTRGGSERIWQKIC